MNTLGLLREAAAARLEVSADGPRLVVRGPENAAQLVRRVLASQPEVMAVLEGCRRLLERLRNAGYEAHAVGAGRLRVTPPPPPRLREALAARKEFLVSYLALTTPAAARAGLDADADEPWPPATSWPMDWHQEYRLERATLRERLRRCSDPEVEAVLRGLLAAPSPAHEAEWLTLGATWRDAEVALAEQGRLPACPWPAPD